jgi:hypothetical protein
LEEAVPGRQSQPEPVNTKQTIPRTVVIECNPNLIVRIESSLFLTLRISSPRA